MSRHFSIVLFSCVAAAVSSASFAQSTSLDAVLSCRSIEKDKERLACFDAAANSIEGSLAAAESAAPPAPPAAVASAATQESEFGADGFRGKLAARQKSDEEPELDSIEVAVIEIGKTGFGKAIIILENGHVWRQIDSDEVRFRAPASLDGVTAVISRGALGSYRLKLGKNRVIRVRRLS